MKLPRLVALSPGNLERARSTAFLTRLGRALEAGLPGVLVREPRLTDRAYATLFEAVRDLCGGFDGVWVGVHDRAHLALALGADAVHLGFRSLSPASLRARFGAELSLGLSTHADDDRASWREADYLFHGPVHATESKLGWKEPVGLEGLRRAAAATDRPVLALGGIRPADVAGALQAGAHGVAVLSGILGREDAGAATTEYAIALGSTR